MADKPLFNSTYNDPSDFLANHRGQFLEFFSVPNGVSVAFKAYITLFSDRFESDWNEEEAFGRMDPISSFKRTKRVISLGWTVIAGSQEEAIENLEKVSLLKKMLYPTYESLDSGAAGIQTSPLFKLRFMNLITNVAAQGQTAETGGLLGKVGGFTHDVEMEDGFFDILDGGIEKLYPQTIKLSCEYTVLHEHQLGWSNKKERNKFGKFPYGDVLPGRDTETTDASVDTGSTFDDSRKRQVSKAILSKGVK